ncbi:hypothetical protein AVEN_42968-1 [Araneus ventricosus]|uniref:DDE Tnp4 domain-containing protein n=1 Tax=Araneus ventricosus TaxID=182803 RepID=A0A4Y2AHP3_ARAVE|nr:hypothetical protein AVEN_42968-1 [Araneus ventricosus]
MGVSVGTATSPEELEQNVDIENDTSSTDFNATNEAESTDNSSENEAVEPSKYKKHMATEIEKPSDPVSQAFTWSAYYNCNALKYLVSCTPDGLVTLISEGFGGRASDVLIVENSGFMNNLFPGTAVMDDRGFKSISYLLQQKNCNLFRPPPVSAAKKVQTGS